VTELLGLLVGVLVLGWALRRPRRAASPAIAEAKPPDPRAVYVAPALRVLLADDPAAMPWLNRLVAARLDQTPPARPRLAGLHHVDETGACACGWRRKGTA
jgi:hypothetical protein